MLYDRLLSTHKVEYCWMLNSKIINNKNTCLKEKKIYFGLKFYDSFYYFYPEKVWRQVHHRSSFWECSVETKICVFILLHIPWVIKLSILWRSFDTFKYQVKSVQISVSTTNGVEFFIAALHKKIIAAIEWLFS